MLVNAITPFTKTTGNKIKPANTIKFGSFGFKKTNKKQFPAQSGQFITAEGRRIFNRHTTSYFRGDLNWGEFINLLKEKYAGEKKVNTYIWGCSRGDEVYTLSMILKTLPQAEAEKYYPIIAKDINPNIIAEAKIQQQEGVIVNDFGMTRIKSSLGEDMKENELFSPMNNKFLKLNSEITKDVKFGHANIVTGLNIMDSENPSIVFCRNMWPYINPDKYQKCAEKLYDKLAKGSIVVLGDCDCFGEIGYFGSNDFPNKLIEAGFKPLYDCCVGHRKSFSQEELSKYALIYEKA